MQGISPVRYLDTVQPDWDDLPLACELLNLWSHNPDSELRDLALASGNVQAKKLSGVINLLGKLELIDEDGVTPRGQFLVDSHTPAKQQSYLGEEAGIGLKNSLSQTECWLLWLIIYYEHRVPMLAVIHQVSTESVPVSQDPESAESFGKRIDELYPAVESDQSWLPRAKVHYKWLGHFDLAHTRSGRYTLSTNGENLLKQVGSEFPAWWDDLAVHDGPTLLDFTA